jgi:hypothetical protein
MLLNTDTAEAKQRCQWRSCSLPMKEIYNLFLHQSWAFLQLVMEVAQAADAVQHNGQD